jgi:hypothetical protein
MTGNPVIKAIWYITLGQRMGNFPPPSGTRIYPLIHLPAFWSEAGTEEEPGK